METTSERSVLMSCFLFFFEAMFFLFEKALVIFLRVTVWYIRLHFFVFIGCMYAVYKNR
jgi:hypothetical protein